MQENKKLKVENIFPIDFDRIQLPDGKSWIFYCAQVPEFLRITAEQFELLENEMPIQRQKVKFMGKDYFPERRFAAYGRDYHFSSENHSAQPIENPFLKKLLKFVCDFSGKDYNGILVNWYGNGNAKIGAHSDSLTGLVPDSAIYSFSFGATRKFRVRGKKNSDYSDYLRDFDLSDGSLIIMGGDMQKNFTHEVPSQTSVKDLRINITIRHFE